MLDSLFPPIAAQHLYELAATDERERLERYKRAWEAYRGELPDTLRVKRGQPNDNVQASKCRVIVDTAVSFLFGQNIEFEISDQEDTPEEQWLDACWQANRKMTLLNKLGVNGAVCGHAFIKIVPNHPSTSPYPRLIVLDPANVSCTWDDDDIETVTEYRIQWNAIDPQTRKAIVRRQVVTRQSNGYWLIRDFMSLPGNVANRWILTGEQLWPYTWSPVIDCQNIAVPNEFWGEADIPTDIINLTQSRNFALSNWARIIKYQAHQRLWGKGFRDDQVKLGVDDIFIIESDAGQLASIEPTSNMAGLSDLDRRLDEAIHEGSRTPAIATGKVEGIGQLSGVALQILYGPLVQKIEAKRQTYGDMLRLANRYLLELGGYGAEIDINIVWPEILPQDMQAERASLQVDMGLGVVSKSTVAQKLGYDWDTEQARMQAEVSSADGQSDIPTEDEGKRLQAVFTALKDAVDAGIPIETFLSKYLAWSKAELGAITQAQEDQQASELEAQQRQLDMLQMQQGGMNGEPGQQQPGQTQAPRPIGGTANGGGVGAAGGNG